MLKCVLFNAQSIGNKLLELHYMLYTLSYDVVLVTESWLDASITSGLLDPDDKFYILRNDRNRKGGGVCVFVNKRFQVLEVVINSRFAELEILCFDILYCSADIRFFLVYRPPGYSPECVKYFSNMIECFESHYKLNSMNVIAGDFNCPKVIWDRLQCSADRIHHLLLDFVIDYGLVQIVSFNTRHKHVLDIVLTDEPQRILQTVSKPPLGQSDHDMVVFDVLLHCNNLKDPSLVELPLNYKLWHLADYDAANSYLYGVDWYSIMFSNPSSNSMWSAFVNVIQHVTALFVPVKKINKCSSKATKHYPKNVRSAMAKKRHLWKLRKAQPDNLLIQLKYRESILWCKYQIKDYEKQVEAKVVDSNNVGSFYKHVNRRIKCRSGVSPLIGPDNEPVNDDLSKAQLLNKFFASVSVPDNGIMPTVIEDIKIDSKLESVTFTRDKVLKAMKKLKSNLSSGPDGLPPVFFKRLNRSLADPLAMIYTQLMSVSAVPPEWKGAIVIPVYKKGASSDPSNYRPISLTCVSSKIMERVIVDELMNHFYRYNIISTAQHGFLKQLSTCTNLLETINDWTLSLQNYCGITVAYVDFAKAFDTVPHQKLLFRLQSYGVDGCLLAWLSNFLSHRTLCTRVGNSLSSELELISGVIQGSGIGPLLFVSYINELAAVLGRCNVIVKLFADDLKMYAVMKTVFHADMFQHALDRLATWADEWQLQISITKCFIMHIGKVSVDRTFSLNGQALPSSDTCKDLGVIVNSNLTPSSHIASITVTANQRVNLIYRSFVSRDINLLVRAFITYVRPILEYNSVTWSPYYKSDIECIEKVQRRFTRWLPGFKSLTYNQRLKRLNLPSLELRRLHADLVMCYKIVFGLVKLSFTDFFAFRPVTVTRGHQYKLYVNHSRGIRKHFFTERVVAPWNSLPADTDFSSLNRFKRCINAVDFRKFLTVGV